MVSALCCTALLACVLAASCNAEVNSDGGALPPLHPDSSASAELVAALRSHRPLTPSPSPFKYVEVNDGYMRERSALVLAERDLAVGAGIPLTSRELQLDGILAAAKQKEYHRQPTFLPSEHFFKARGLIAQSPLFALLRRMPKGGALHVHSDSMVDVAWLIADATYDDYLHVCGQLAPASRNASNSALTFRFFDSPAAAPPCGYATGWRQLTALRNSSRNGAAAFDKALLAALTLGDDPSAYPTKAAVWGQFEHALAAVDGIIFYDPVHTRYVMVAGKGTAWSGGGSEAVATQANSTLHDPAHRPARPPAYLSAYWLHIRASALCMCHLLVYQLSIRPPSPAPYAKLILCRYIQHALETFHDDGVALLELRQLIIDRAGTYTLNGTVLPAEDMLTKLQATSDAFRVAHPDSFIGVRVIYCSLRFAPAAEIGAALAHAAALRRQFPRLVAGYDLVGREDTGRPLLYYRQQLQAAQVSAQAGATSTGDVGLSLPYFFHAGETDWKGVAADLNLVDALLLNTSRIGHGFALGGHPLLRALVRERSVGVEVCPISNQVLQLVNDLQNHPLRLFLAEGLPVTISPDDPALWGASGSTYDFFQACLLSGNSTGLATLKQLSWNSLSLSSLASVDKDQAIRQWLAQWDIFVDTTLQLHGSNSNGGGYPY